MRSEPDTVGTVTVAASRVLQARPLRPNGLTAYPAARGSTLRAGVLPTPLWVCLCGARNCLRDHYCRACGHPKP